MAASSCDPKPGPAETWVIAGQSNAVGHSQIPAVFGWPANLGVGSVWAAGLPRWREVEWGKVHTLGSTTIGPWPRFVALRHAETNRPQWLVATAVGDTGLVPGRDQGDGNSGRWYPGGVFRGIAYPPGDLYVRMLDTVAQSGRPCTAVLWLQGEYEAQWWWSQTSRDTASRQDAFDSYRDALLDLADAVAADLGCPLVAMPISLVECEWTSCPKAPADKRIPIHDATIAAWGVGNVLPAVRIDKLIHNPNDNAHIFDVYTLAEGWLDAVDQDGF